MSDITLNKIVAIGLAIFMGIAAKQDWMDKGDIIILGVAVYGSQILIIVINLFEKIAKLEDKFLNKE